MIKLSMDHAVIIFYCHASLCGQLWAVIETLFLPFMGQYLSNRGDCHEKIILISIVIL